MKTLIRLIGTIYIIVVSWLAIPTVLEWYNDDNYAEITTLEASASDEQWEFLKDYAELIQYADMLGYKLTAGEIQRTMYQQRKYVRDGLSWTYNSYHLKRKAGDLNLFIDGRYQTSKEAYRELAIFWEGLDPHNKWGGRFNDAPHFERRNTDSILEPL